MISLNNQPCCVCGHTESELAWETSYPEHGYPGSFSLRRCRSCKLLFNSPRLDEGELGELYGRSYYFFNRADSPEFDRAVLMYRRSVGLVAGKIEEKRVLDIGGGRGYLPALLKQLGWGATAVEISSNASAYARSKFGVDVFTGTIESYCASEQKRLFPLVTAIDVIEHVPDPVAFIAAAAAVMEPGGRLIIDTPNAASGNIQFEGLTWQGFNPFHIYLFNPDNLAKLLESYGLAIEKRFTYGNIPADRGGKPPIARLGAVARRKLPAVLLGPAAKAFFAVRRWGSSDGKTEDNLARTAVAAGAPGTYLDSRDAKEELAASLAGDNLVIIARKILTSVPATMSDPLEQLFALYRAAFPANERRAEADLRFALATPAYRLLTKDDDGTLLGFAIVFVPPADDFALLEYLAVEPLRQNAGIGRELVTSAIGQSEGRHLLAEAEIPQNNPDALRRHRFYSRCGFRRIQGLHYLLPLPGNPPPMEILVHPAPNRSISRRQVRRWVTKIYTDVYQCSSNDPRIARSFEDSA